MRNVRIRIEEESYLSLDGISECYQCQVAWLQEAYELGLFGSGREHAGRLVLSVTILDRVAEVIRLHRYEGLGLDAIVILLGEVREVSTEYYVEGAVIVHE